MASKNTKNDFLQRAKSAHGLKYNYSKVDYINCDTKVEIICPVHGTFFQTPYKHYKGQNCPKCVHNYKSDTESFIKKAKNKHGERFDYSLVKYVSSAMDVEIICKKHGIFYQSVGSHLRGSGCIKCNKENQSINQLSNLDEFIEKSIRKHGNRYDYSMVEYKNAQIKVKIRCPKHNYIFEQQPNSHLRGSGCYFCGKDIIAKSLTMTTDEFIQKSNILHKYKYDYSESDYKNTQTKIKIICKQHGIFTQVPNSHLSGNGCKKCGLILSTKHHQENPTGWNYKNWIKVGLKSKVFTGFKVYIIKCFDDSVNETFYKIGKTYKDINKRFIKSVIPYEYEIIKIFEGDGREISELEKLLQKKNKIYKYLPKKEFRGMYECFIKLTDETLNYKL